MIFSQLRVSVIYLLYAFDFLLVKKSLKKEKKIQIKLKISIIRLYKKNYLLRTIGQ